MKPKTDKPLQFAFVCPLQSGLHARPASHLAEAANQFVGKCVLTNQRNGVVADCKSVLGIIAADVRHGDSCTIQTSGSDQEASNKALRKFVNEVLPGCDVPLPASSAPTAARVFPRALRSAQAKFIIGNPLSRGIGRGKVVNIKRMSLQPQPEIEPAPDHQLEFERLHEAVKAVRDRLGEKLKYSVTPTGSAILQADLAIASDVVLLEKLSQEVRRGKSAAQAIVETGEFYMRLLDNSENEYIRQRSIDIEEICVQMLQEVGGARAESPLELREPSVLVAETLGPQQLLALDRRLLKALVLEESGNTSHTAILARSLGIPTLAGVLNARIALPSGIEVVVDAVRGYAIPQPSSDIYKFYERETRTWQRRKEAWEQRSGESGITADGRRLEVGANASSVEELTLAFDNGADGIGLFRTEMLFLGREGPPTEEEQFAVYAAAARNAGSRPVIVRTFDIGGDKRVPYLNLPAEENPFLGARGVRLYAKHHDLLQTQLRAILRASTSGDLQIMAPMITSVDEILEFKQAVRQAQQDLAQNGAVFRPDVKIGIMVEVPAVAFQLERFCEAVDFFSIGTNDLAQYFFAADRTSVEVASLLNCREPAFLRFLSHIVDQIRGAGKWIGVCGEMAADRRNLPLLIGLGLDEISVPAAEVFDCKRTIAMYQSSDCVDLLARAMDCRNGLEVDEFLSSQSASKSVPLLTDELVLLTSTSQTKEQVIQEIVDAFYVSGRTDDRDVMEEALWARETEYSTGLGHGFAIPHCKTDAVLANSICILRLKDPIDWDSIQGERVRMVVTLAMRKSESTNSHMQVFSSLARKLDEDTFRESLLALQTPEQITAYLSEQLGLVPSPEPVHSSGSGQATQNNRD